MMNQKINTNCKKETLLTGQICFPLRIGNVPLLSEPDPVPL